MHSISLSPTDEELVQNATTVKKNNNYTYKVFLTLQSAPACVFILEPPLRRNVESQQTKRDSSVQGFLCSSL